MRKGARRKGGNMLREIKVSLEPPRSGRGDFVGEQVSLVSAAAILSSLSFPFLLFCRVVNQARITRGSHCIVLRQGRRGGGRGRKKEAERSTLALCVVRENTDPFTGNHPFTQAFPSPFLRSFSFNPFR